MRKTRNYFLLGLPLLSLLTLFYTNYTKPNIPQPKIDLSKYNAISNQIDSVIFLIEKTDKEILTLKNEIERLKMFATNVECDSIKKKKNSTSDIDSLSKPVYNCDTLKLILKQNEMKMREHSESISKCNQEYKLYQEKISDLKGQLQFESKTIVSITSKCNGSFTINFKGTHYNLFIANTDSTEIKMHWLYKSKRNYGTIRNLLKYLKDQKTSPLMITNAGMYTPSLKPQGLYIEQFGKELRPLDLKSPKTDANFYLKPNGVYFIDTFGVSHIETTEDFHKLYVSNQIAPKYATQSGPMLLVDGAIHPSFTERSYNKKIRSGVGIIDKKRTLFTISLNEENFYDFALLFKDVFGCKNALFLDGAISQMYLKDIAPNELGGQFGALISVIEK